MKKQLVFLLLCALPMLVMAQTQPWQKKRANLMTSWGGKVTDINVLPEYPRPQMERTDWMNLNGVWGLTKGTSNRTYSSTRNFPSSILVPFPVESAISGIMDSDHQGHKYYWYKKRFTLPASFAGQEVLLHFGAVDWDCDVYVNGTKVGSHQGGYDPFSFNITEALTASGLQEIQVYVFDYLDYGQPKGKQSRHPGGIWYIPCSGIWQTVWLEPVNKIHIDDFHVVPDIDKGQISLTVSAANATAKTKAEVKILDGKNEISTTTLEVGKKTTISVPNAKLWSPKSPFLYDMKIVLKEEDKQVDEVKSYFGMRKISTKKIGSYTRILLNNEEIFQLGVLDQGYWPDGNYTAPTDEALLFDVVKTKELGFNMIRKHIKVEPARWYYHCDRLGMLVWQDIPNTADVVKAGESESGPLTWRDNNFYREMENIMKALKNVPSIITWVTLNEGWGQYDNDRIKSYREQYTRTVVAKAKQIDPSRLVDGVSGWHDYEVSDMVDRHSYPPPARPGQTTSRAKVCGEFGGITLSIKGHIWNKDDQVYVSVKDNEELTQLICDYFRSIQLQKTLGLNAGVYTQIIDVENENNGLITYDRAVEKFTDEQKERVRFVVTDVIENQEPLYTIFHSGRTGGESWKYTTAPTVPDNWNQPAFDDSSWKNGASGFGGVGLQYFERRTAWTDNQIYLRKYFDLGDVKESAMRNYFFEIYYDEDYEIYINGVLANKRKGYSTDYTAATISAEALATLKPNSKNNLIAVKCIQDKGGQGIDVGLRSSKDPYKEDLVSIANPVAPMLLVVPNPVDGTFRIAGNILESQVDIYALDGQLKKSFAETAASYDVSDLSSGVYIVRVLDDNSKPYTQRIIKQ